MLLIGPIFWDTIEQDTEFDFPIHQFNFTNYTSKPVQQSG
jgi:hypothetical protein